MNTGDLLDVNPILIDRVRLAIMTHLAVTKGVVDFNTLLQELELSKGNLSTHMRKLEGAELIKVKKEFVGRKPRTTYSCTTSGKAELKRYLAMLETLLKNNV